MSHIIPRYYLDLPKDTISYAIWQVKIYRKYSMIFAGIIIVIVILAAMIYLAIDKKSTLIIRLASLGAIALMFITLVICTIVILNDNTVPVDPSVLIVGAPTEKKEVKNNSVAIAFIIIFVIAMFAFIAITAMREQKKNKSKTEGADNLSKPVSDW
jgi:lysylphosphatidylglycerol synthetase-like protein (DUF2156 family)